MYKFIISIFFLASCSDTSEQPIADFTLPTNQLDVAMIAGNTASLAQQLGFRIETNDPEEMAFINDGNPATSIWLFNGNKHVANVFTVNQGKNIRIMLFESGFYSNTDLSLLEKSFRDAYE